MAKTKIRHARRSDSPALGRIVVEANQIAFQDRVPDKCLNGLTPEESATNWAKSFESEKSFDANDNLFVAEIDNDIIGLAMMSEISLDDANMSIYKQYSHEVNTIQVYPKWQRQGIGRQLITRIAIEMWKDTKTHLLVGVLAENPNQEFYRTLGAIRLGTRPYDWNGYKTDEIIYGFEHIQELLGLLKS